MTPTEASMVGIDEEFMKDKSVREFDEKKVFDGFNKFAKTWENVRPCFAEEFLAGARWQHDQHAAEVATKEEVINQVLEYCKPHTNQMWAAVIVGILLKCDFQDASSALAAAPKRDDDGGNEG